MILNKLNGKKIFAVVDKDNTVVDIWIADTLNEAQKDNPYKTVYEITETNSPVVLGEKINNADIA